MPSALGNVCGTMPALMDPPRHEERPAAARSARFAAAYRAWRRERVGKHLAAIALLVLVMVLRWPSTVFSPFPVEDEGVYFAAFRLAARGESPYRPGYFYTPAFAVAGGWAIERLGEVPVLAGLRLANLFGMALIAWCSLAWMPWPWRRRWLTAAAFVALSPVVRFAVLWGNLSLWVVGMLLVALLAWRARPVLAGMLLGLSIVIKPIGPLAAVILLVHRPAGGGRRHLVAATLGLALAAGLLFSFPYLDDFLALKGGNPQHGRNLALHHLLYCFGIEVEALTLAAAVSLIAIVLARRRTLAPAHFVAFTATMTLLTTPLVWSHTLLLALPVVVLALAVAADRWTRSRAHPRGGGALRAVLRRWEPAFVVSLALAMQLAGGLGGVETWSRWQQGLFAAPPALAAVVLTVYLFATTDPF